MKKIIGGNMSPMAVKPGANAAHLVQKIYERGRSFPYGKSPSEPASRPARASKGDGLDDYPAANNLSEPQDIQDRHGPGYANETSGWVRGQGGDATKKPSFDHSPARNKTRR